jgi:hypothetical protein
VSWVAPRNKARIFEHAATCGVISNIGGHSLQIKILNKITEAYPELYVEISKMLD